MGFIGDALGSILGAPSGPPKWTRETGRESSQFQLDVAKALWAMQQPLLQQQTGYAGEQIGYAQQLLPFLLQYAGQRLTGMPSGAEGFPSLVGDDVSQHLEETGELPDSMFQVPGPGSPSGTGGASSPSQGQMRPLSQGAYSRTPELEAMARQRADIERMQTQAMGGLQQNLAQRLGSSAASPTALGAALADLSSQLTGQNIQGRIAATQQARAEEGQRLGQLASLVPGLQPQAGQVLAATGQGMGMAQGAGALAQNQAMQAQQAQQQFMQMLMSLGGAIGGMGGSFPQQSTLQYNQPGISPYGGTTGFNPSTGNLQGYVY